MGNSTIDPTKKAGRSNQEPLRQERENMQKPPQIIVIPQSMLAGQKSLLRLAPSPMNRNTSALLSTSSPSPLLSSAAISPMLSSNPRPVAAVVGSKRPAPSVSPQPKELLLDIKEENTENEAPARKRANLDHLSPEERMMRRKLKNRVAAQTARDKKKAATDSMEKQLADVQARLQESLDANAQLLKTNTHQPLTLTFALSASSLEEETYPPVGLSLNTDIGFDLGDTLNTPTTTTTTGNILDGFLADTEMMAMADSEKWEKSLDDLFPDLD